MRPERLCHVTASTVIACGIVLATAATVRLVSHSPSSDLPQLTVPVLLGDAPWHIGALIAAVTFVVFVALFVPARRVLKRVGSVDRRVVGGCFALTAIGYLGYVVGSTWVALLSVVTLLCSFPLVFAAVDGRLRSGSEPRSATERTIVLGSDEEEIERFLGETKRPVVGYLSPLSPSSSKQHDTAAEAAKTAPRLTDGGTVAGTRLDETRRLGELSQLPSVLKNYDVDRAILAFSVPDRTDFFGTLATCHDYGVSATVRRECAGSVLIERTGSEMVDVDLEPWDRRSRSIKRLFDEVFALTALVVLIPVIVAIAVAIKLDSTGPVFYSQVRTTRFGRTFRVQKFRTMTPDSEDIAPINDEENTRITRIGRLLRRTHLDEIPQLYSILVGDMSVVGPRAAWVREEEEFLDVQNGQWRKRWFVKPGLTGLAQVNDVSSTDPELKLHYDIEYIRRQSLTFDVSLVARQIWIVVKDLLFRETGT